MKIVKFEVIPEVELLAKIRKVRLRGFDRAEVYKDTRIEISQFHTEALTPCQKYVLRADLQTAFDVHDAFLKQYQIDTYALNGGLLFWIDDMDLSANPIPLLPPVVEEDVIHPGVWIVNDGMHRVYSARRDPSKINVIAVSGISNEYPYYAEPLKFGWSEVEEITELTEGFKKKTYRNPDNYKALFRDFNEIFDGIQKDRKQTQVNIKE